MKKHLERLPEVGIFFVVNNLVYGWGNPVSEIKPCQGFYDSSMSHMDYWDELTHSIPELFEYRFHEYTYFSRGRILYNDNEKVFICYADKCILRDKHLKNLLIEEFALPINRTFFKEDEHYQCHNCNSEIENYQKLNEKFYK